MKKLISILFCLALLFSLASCSMICQHRDEDDNDLCDKCGEAYTDGKDVFPPEHVHAYSAWAQYGNDATLTCDGQLYSRICSGCGNIEWKYGGYESHNFTTVTVEPTCDADGYDENTCTKCSYTEKINYVSARHNLGTEYSFDKSFHWFACSACDAKESYAEHVIDDSGCCTTCGQPLSETEGIIYDISQDGTYAIVVGYEGTATKVLIASEYQGLPVKSIYSEAFKNSNITAVTIPDSVTTIGYNAFRDCDSLTSVVIGDSVTTIENYAFYDCDSLTSVVIGDSVTTIGDRAFSSCSSLTSVVIPDSVECIGNYAFQYCSSLTSVVIGDSVTTIGDYAFSNCSSLTSVVIPDSVTNIGSSAFAYCSSLTSVIIPDSVTNIGGHAFYDCSSLTSIVIGDSVTNIGSSAFSGCNSAIYTEYEYGKYVRSGDNPYAVLIELTNKNLSTYTINENTQVIATSAFQDCARLTNINIPDSVKGISIYAFYHCNSLTSIHIGNNVTTLEPGAFQYCSSLTSVVIPDSVEYIGDAAFFGCTSLTSIVIPDSVTTINYQAFYDCPNLKSVYYSGTAEDWTKISIGDLNDELTTATRYYYSETKPTAYGNWWHYDENGKAVIQ